MIKPSYGVCIKMENFKRENRLKQSIKKSNLIQKKSKENIEPEIEIQEEEERRSVIQSVKKMSVIK